MKVLKGEFGLINNSSCRQKIPKRILRFRNSSPRSSCSTRHTGNVTNTFSAERKCYKEPDIRWHLGFDTYSSFGKRDGGGERIWVKLEEIFFFIAKCHGFEMMLQDSHFFFSFFWRSFVLNAILIQQIMSWNKLLMMFYCLLDWAVRCSFKNRRKKIW